MSKSDLMRKIHDEVISLENSPLYEYRIANKFLPVIGEGSFDAKIMFIGEAPGRNEAKTGKPFCGSAGKVFDKLLTHVGIARGSVYVTNIVKDRPPENRDPTAKEIEIYGPFLDRQIEIIKPTVVVALGRYAMGYLMNRFGLQSLLEPIGKAHGKSYPTNLKVGPKNIVTLYHPCVAVYNPNNLTNLKKDFEVLKKYVK